MLGSERKVAQAVRSTFDVHGSTFAVHCLAFSVRRAETPVFTYHQSPVIVQPRQVRAVLWITTSRFQAGNFGYDNMCKCSTRVENAPGCNRIRFREVRF
jgi:hypothetical protein